MSYKNTEYERLSIPRNHTQYGNHNSVNAHYSKVNFNILCLKNDPTVKWYRSKIHGWILIFDRNVQMTLE